MKRVCLPDGVAIWTLTEFEAKLLYREIVSESTYQKHGIVLPAGATVFDVGANIGMYAMHLSRTVPGVRVRCFEPVPATMAVLERNLAEHAPAAVAVNVGLAATAGTADIVLDRYSTITASTNASVFTAAAPPGTSVARWALAALEDIDRVESSAPIRLLRRGMTRSWSRPITLAAMAPIALGLEIRKRLFSRRYHCRFSTFSTERAASGFDRIDLAKIDVEGAEEDVLAGIADADWPRIRQLVVEVHDVNGRLARITELLEQRGYAVSRDREDWSLHELMGISTLYAIRR